MTPPDFTLLRQSSWPASGLGRALRELVRETGLVAAPPEVNDPNLSADDGIRLTAAGARLGIEIVSVSNTCGELEGMLRRLGPSLLRLAGPDEGEARYLALIGGGSLGLKVITPEHGVRRLRVELVQDGLIHHLVEAEQASVGRLINDLGLEEQIGDRGLRAFAIERLSEKPVLGIWLVRPSPGSAASVQARATHLPLLLGLLVVARALSTGLFLALWILIGRDVFASNGFRPSIGLWAACALSMVPLRLLDSWAQSRLALDAGALFKDSLLFGVLNLDRTAVR